MRYFFSFQVDGWAAITTRKCCLNILVEGLNYCRTYENLKLPVSVIMINYVHCIFSSENNPFCCVSLAAFTSNTTDFWQAMPIHSTQFEVSISSKENIADMYTEYSYIAGWFSPALERLNTASAGLFGGKGGVTCLSYPTNTNR